MGFVGFFMFQQTLVRSKNVITIEEYLHRKLSVKTDY